MIFDSVLMQRLREEYASVPDCCVPKVVFLDRSADLAGERQYLETLLQSVPEAQKRRWLKFLLTDDHGNHLGAWFEIMLYGWLQRVGRVVIEPDVGGDLPDFSVTIHGQQVIVEAWAHQERRRKFKDRFAEVLSLVQSVVEQAQEPYIIHVENYLQGTELSGDHFVGEVTQWLAESPGRPLKYRDEGGNEITLVATASPQRAVYGTSERVKSVLSKSRLQKKARQHGAVPAAGYPYVIAVFLESPSLTARAAVTAWFGRMQVEFNHETLQITDRRLDESGLYFEQRISQRRVSGTLVFKKRFNSTEQRHELRAWYVQNPNADVPFDSNLFPVEARFLVLGRSSTGGYLMDWR